MHRLKAGILAGPLLAATGCGLDERPASPRAETIRALTEGQAIEMADRFLSLIGWRHPRTPVQAMRSQSGIPERDVSLGEASVHVDAESGRIRRFQDYRRERMIVYSKGKARQQIFKTDSQARAHAAELARKVGIPNTAYLRSWSRLKDGTIGFSYSIGPRDYPTRFGGNGWGFSFDAANGEIATYGCHLDTVFVAPVLNIEKREALEIAQAVWDEQRLIDEEPGKRKPKEIVLSYALPFRRMAFEKGSTRHLYVARLCWVVLYPRGRVAVDAETGDIYDLGVGK